MRVLEAVQDLLSTNVTANFDEECPFCGMNQSPPRVEHWVYVDDSFGAGHHPECSWLALPQIIKALEAAQTLVTGGFVTECDGLGDYGEYSTYICGACGERDSNGNIEHTSECGGVALRAVLSDPTSTA